jgi:hypothetical protein
MDISPSNPSTTSAYIAGRKRYARPQAMIWANNFGTIAEGIRLPLGNEKEDYIVLSDHNRGEISIAQQRVETRQRMINATMRSYHVADKITVSCSWNRLPSRSYSRNVNFNSAGQPTLSGATEHTVDGGAGGVELLDWYENNSGPFYVYLAYDKYNNDSFKVAGNVTDESFNYLSIYNDVRLMYFANFDYSIEKRGGTNFDFWNINVSLEEA